MYLLKTIYIPSSKNKWSLNIEQFLNEHRPTDRPLKVLQFFFTLLVLLTFCILTSLKAILLCTDMRKKPFFSHSLFTIPRELEPTTGTCAFITPLEQFYKKQSCQSPMHRKNLPPIMALPHKGESGNQLQILFKHVCKKNFLTTQK